MEDHKINEFRQDLVSGDWVLFATDRNKTLQGKVDNYQPKEGCPFENPRASGQEIISFYPNEENWLVAVIKNKYPAVRPGTCSLSTKKGMINISSALGFHEVIIMRDHNKHIYEYKDEQVADLFRVYRDRYLEIAKFDCGHYISIFHNHGEEAGASIYHPHSQILSTPILPLDVMRSIKGSEKFYKLYGKKVHDVLIGQEVREGKRIIDENEKFIALCPFVSKKPYEIRIFPKESNPRFETIIDEDINYLAQITKTVLHKLSKVLDRPPYNYFIHTSPLVEDLMMVSSKYYHWHLEIVPNLKIDAGFELGTGIDVNVINPDHAAAELKVI